jgi:hypothetical protein
MKLSEKFSLESGLKLAPVLIMFFSLAAKCLPHPPNFSPIAAMALFGGVYFGRRSALLLPLAVLFVSDLFLGFYGSVMIVVYGSFLLIGLMGMWLKKHKNPGMVVATSLMASIVFFLITNLAVWAGTAMYSKDFAGLMQSYTMALPFFRNTLLGDLFFTGIFFGAYELARSLGKKYLPEKVFSVCFQ